MGSKGVKVDGGLSVPKAVVGKISGDKELLKEAQQRFMSMQQSWYLFAKVVHSIKVGECYLGAGYTSFKDYIETEFPTLNYDVAIRFADIIESWGATFEARFKREPDYLLPAYDTCYTLISAERRKVAAKEDLAKIKKQVLDNKLSYRKLKEALKTYIGSAKSDVLDDSTEEIENQLVEDLKKDGDLDEMDFIEAGVSEDMFDDADDADDADEDEDSEEDNDESDNGAAMSALLARVDYLIDNLPAHKSDIKEITDDLVHFATRLDALMEIVEGYLTKVENLSNK